MKATLCPYCLKMVNTDHCPYCGSDVNYPGNPMHLPVGTILEGSHTYILGAAVGQGGFGVTYIALDALTNERIAIKEYFPTHCSGRSEGTVVQSYLGQEEIYAKGKESFLQEAQMIYSLSDISSIVNVRDYFEANNSAYLVMEYLEGCSLKDYVMNSGKIPAQDFLHQLHPLMEDMETMHQRGVIHRDIAPDNIMLLTDGRLKLIDFGAARSYLGDKSMTVVVKAGFAPVEQYLKKGLNAATDVYALAATIYYCITGIVPPDSAERQYGEVTLQAPTSLGVDLTDAQEAALEMALEIQPKERTQSVAELIEGLFSGKKVVHRSKKVTDDEKKDSKPFVIKQPSLDALKGLSKKQLGIGIGAVAVLVLAAIGFIAFGGSNQKSDPALSAPPETILPVVNVSNVGSDAGSNAGPDDVIPPATEQVKPAQSESGFNKAKNNVLMSNPYKDYNEQADQLAFNTEVARRDISSVIILDTLSSAPEQAVDASAAGDGSVMAWTVENAGYHHLYLAGEGGVCAPEDSSYLFAGMSTVSFIDFGDAFYTERVTNMEYMFSSCMNLISLDVSNFNTGNVTNMKGLFHSCFNIISPGVEFFDTSSVTDMSYMFYTCADLTTLDLSHFDTSNVTDMSEMFSLCENLVDLDVSSFNTKNVESMNSMFQSCKKLENIDLRSFDTRKVKQMNFMFKGCPSEVNIQFDNWGTAKLSMSMDFMDENTIVNGKPWGEVFPVNYAITNQYK